MKERKLPRHPSGGLALFWRVGSLIATFSLVACLQEGCGPSMAPPSTALAHSEGQQPRLLSVSNDQLARLHLTQARYETWSIAVHTTGTVDWNADHTSQAITQVSGPISRILVDLGTPVKKGQPLLYVSSPDISNAVSTYRKAHSQQDLAKRTLDRAREMYELGAIAQKDLEQAQAGYDDATTDVQNGLEALKIFNISKEQMDDAAKQGVPVSSEMPVRSPIDGVIIQKLVSPGQLVQAGTTACFLVSDTSSVWVQGHIFDRDLPAVHNGDPAEETNTSLPNVFHGMVSYVGAFVDPATRTTPVRIVTRNPGGLLKKDMFVDAVIHTSTRKNVLTVPVSAILRDTENLPIVYVEAAPGKFAQRVIDIGAQHDDQMEVVKGLKEGETVVSEGSVFLQFASNYQ